MNQLSSIRALLFASIVIGILAYLAYIDVIRPYREQQAFVGLCADGRSVVVSVRDEVYELNGSDASEFLWILTRCTGPDDRIGQNVSGKLRIDIFKENGGFLANVLLDPGGEGIRIYEILVERARFGRLLSEEEASRVYGPRPDCRECIERTYYD